MSANDYRLLTAELSELIGRLKQRCLIAEARVAQMQQQLDEHQARIAALEAESASWQTKYQHLQSGLAATGDNPEGIDRLKEQYLAMVSELDACIEALQHG